jgi:D-3-phosphoglycerate dehydrogenase
MKAAVFCPLEKHGRILLQDRMDVEYFGWAVKQPVTTPLPDDDEIIAHARDAQVIITPGELSNQVIQNCPQLKIIAIGRGDPRGVDLAEATRHGIQVVYAAGRNASAVVEMTVAFIIMLLRKLLPAHQFVEEHRWKTWDNLFQTDFFNGEELQGKVLGLVGFGIIGKEVARRICQFGMQVVYYDPYQALDDAFAIEGEVKKVELDQLLKQADVISIHCKLTPETTGLLGQREFGLMKNGAYLINTGRAAIVDRQAFLEAMRSEKLTGAALDVYWQEPLAVDDPIIDIKGIIHTPHIGGATAQMDLHTTEIIMDEIIRILDGREPRYPANSLLTVSR